MACKMHVYIHVHVHSAQNYIPSACVINVQSKNNYYAHVHVWCSTSESKLATFILYIPDEGLVVGESSTTKGEGENTLINSHKHK